MMYYTNYKQSDDRDMQYRITKEAIKAAMHCFERLQSYQQQRLLQELIQEKTIEELFYKMESLYSQ